MNLAIVNPTSGGLSGGYRKYLQRIVPVIEKHPYVKKISVYVPQQTEGCFNSTTKNLLSWPNGDHKRDYAWLRKHVDNISPDVVFIPTARYVNFGSIPTVVMIRNMEPLSVPFGGNPFREAIKNIGRAYSAKKACCSADRIIAVSQHIYDFLVVKWHINPDQIDIVYHGVDSPDGLDSIEVPKYLGALADGRFIFTAGSIRPARGLEDLLLAFGFIYSSKPNVKLVIAGSTDPGMEAYKSKLDTMITKLGIIPNVVWAGSLSGSEMSWCYSHCEAFVMTSRAEACPNIVLEAMSHGCSCISTETPPMPEFFKSAAVYYSLRNGEALANAIESVLNWNVQKRKMMSEKARERASQFSWDVCAGKL
jgi:glycosyltransferase involved in cell wall biosynthesis